MHIYRSTKRDYYCLDLDWNIVFYITDNLSRNSLMGWKYEVPFTENEEYANIYKNTFKYRWKRSIIKKTLLWLIENKIFFETEAELVAHELKEL